jgi:anti-sigma-K factor RskA
MTNNALTENDIVLAGEAALGLLGSADRAIVAARIATDRAFADEILLWEERLQPLLDNAADAPAPEVFDKLVAQLGKAATRRPANTTLRVWQAIAGTATAAAAVLAVMLLTPPTQPPSAAPLLVAALSNEAGPAAVTASYDSQQGDLILTPVGLNTGALYPELWVIDGAGDAKSLGIIEANRATRVRVNEALRARMIRGATLAVTLEPRGGAPGGKATGEVIVSGKIEAL